MEELSGRVAVITGGGGGIGEGLAHACAEAGMRVVVADIEADSAERVAAAVREAGGDAIGVAADVSKAESVQALAERAYEAFGEVNILFNNAGVMMVAPIVDTPLSDWEWTLGVNMYGVVNGVQAFVPRMRSQSGPAHIVNTASIAGIGPIEDLPIGTYTASKYAIVGISETLRHELAPDKIGVSVVCPGGVATGIFAAARNRPDELGGPGEPPAAPEPSDDDAPAMEMMGPRAAADRILDGVRADRLYIFTHAEERERAQKRFDAIYADFDAVS